MNAWIESEFIQHINRTITKGLSDVYINDLIYSIQMETAKQGLHIKSLLKHNNIRDASKTDPPYVTGAP